MNEIEINPHHTTVQIENVSVWFKAAHISKFPKNSGACIKYKDRQVAIFNFASEGKWYASQNLCPHKMEMVLARGILGEENMEAKIACPLHKNAFSLKTGAHLNGDLAPITTYPVKVEDDFVYVGFSK